MKLSDRLSLPPTSGVLVLPVTFPNSMNANYKGKHNAFPY